MRVEETGLPGVVVIEPTIHGDHRGFFVETFRESILQAAGVPTRFVQENHSRSSKGVLRGLHYQLRCPQGKLVRVARGAVFDVAVDVRKGSPHFGKWYGTILDEESMRMMYVPPGFAHGFVVLSDCADFLYKCTDYYDPDSEQGVSWDDPDIGIEWPITDVKLSNKDLRHPLLKHQDAALLPVSPV